MADRIHSKLGILYEKALDFNDFVQNSIDIISIFVGTVNKTAAGIHSKSLRSNIKNRLKFINK